jgi:hypothetical protein
VIKAIQTLSQVTLNEVIEKLAALRDGKAGAAISDQSPAETMRKPIPPPAPAMVKETAPPKINKDATPPIPARVTDPGYNAPSQEQPAIGPKDVWRKLVDKVRATRRLIAGWVEAGTGLGIEGRFFVVGFPPEQKTAMESLSIPKTRDYLDALLKEFSGQDWKIKFVLKEGLTAFVPTEAAPANKSDSQATYKDEPLIRDAMEIFKGEIKTVND